MTVFTVNAFAQGTDKRPEMQQELEQLSEQMGQMFDEMKQALGEARFFLDSELDMEKLDEKGTMRIMGDTIDVGMFYDFMAKSFEQFPEQMRPDPEMLEGMKKSAEEIPDLLLESKNFFNNEEINEVLKQFFGDWNIDPIEPKRDEDGKVIPPEEKEYKTPKPDKKKKRKTNKI